MVSRTKLSITKFGGFLGQRVLLLHSLPEVWEKKAQNPVENRARKRGFSSVMVCFGPVVIIISRAHSFSLACLRKAPDTFNFFRHGMRAIWSVRPKCSHSCVSLTETSLKLVQINPQAHNQKLSRANRYENKMVLIYLDLNCSGASPNVVTEILLSRSSCRSGTNCVSGEPCLCPLPKP